MGSIHPAVGYFGMKTGNLEPCFRSVDTALLLFTQRLMLAVLKQLNWSVLKNLAGEPGTGSKKKVNEWLNIRYPAIIQQAEEQDAIIFFLDESTAKSESHRGRTWGIKGLTPVVKTTGSRHRLNLISVVSSEGIMRYKTFTGSMDRFAFVDYLKSLVRSVDKPIIVITDGHPAHRAKFTKEYVEQEPRLLGLHLLPGYSPELNPDEQVWNHLKEELGTDKLTFYFLKTKEVYRLHPQQDEEPAKNARSSERLLQTTRHQLCL